MATAAFSFDRFLKAPPLARAREVERGLPAAALRTLLAGGGMTVNDLVGIVGKRRTLDRRLAENDTLTLEESDRLASFAEVLALSEHIFGDREAAMEWLRAPQFEYEGTPPIEVMRTRTGIAEVLNLLHRFQHGMLA